MATHPSTHSNEHANTNINARSANEEEASVKGSQTSSLSSEGDGDGRPLGRGPWIGGNQSEDSDSQVDDNEERKQFPWKRNRGKFVFGGPREQILELRVHTLLLRSIVNRKTAHPDIARTYANQALDCARKLQDVPLMGRCAFWIAQCYMDEHLYADANQWFALGRKAGDDYIEGAWSNQLFSKLSALFANETKSVKSDKTSSQDSKDSREKSVERSPRLLEEELGDIHEDVNVAQDDESAG